MAIAITDAGAVGRAIAQGLAGNDDSPRQAVAQLLSKLGFEAQDAGDITKSRLLEPFAMVWINLALMRGEGREWAFAAVEG